MTDRLSLRLDAIRASAALMVFTAHFSYLGYTGPGTGFAHHYGHIGVVVFFVLSGYVIGFVGESKHPSLSHFMQARVARLYSVLLPALILTPVLDLLGRAAQPALYDNAPSSSPVARLVVTALFLAQSSLTAVKYFSNGPMWSIPYELWYYVLFGVARYLRGGLRAILLVVIAIVAGHKILLLLPVWALGVGARYLHTARRVPPQRSRRLGLVLTLLVFVCCCEYPALVAWLYGVNAWVAEPLLEHGVALEFSSWFLRDLLVGLVVACALWLMNDGSPGPANGPVAAVVRAIARGSFSIYLFHVPLLLALRASGLAATDTLLGASALGAITLASCAGLAHVSEHRLGFYRRAVGRAASLASSALHRRR